MDILSVVTRVPILVFGVERHDDDFADRINYKYTVAVLVIFAIIVTNRQFGTKQIHCWIPAYFTRNYEEYINDICWVSNTYYISLDQKLPEAEQIRKSFELKYYQWVPFILLSQAFFFYIPHIAWRALSRRSGIDVRDIVEAASNYKSVDKYESRQKYMTYMLTAVDQYVDDPRRRKETRRSLLLLKRLLSGICCISGKFLGNYLMVLYLFIKLAFIGNCICQLFVLNLLLGHEFHKFGFELLDKIINGKGWDTGSRIFPKISMCDFRIREIGNPKVSHRYTVQCVLPINLFNQQIFTFIWFWYGLVLIINIYSLCVWTYRFLPSKRLRYVSRRIEIMRQALLWSHKQRQQHSLSFETMPDLQLHDFERDLIRHFVHDYLESDGLFILRVLSSNTSDFVCTELIQELWKYYRKQRKFNRSSEDEDNEDDLNDDESLEFKKSLEDFSDASPKINRNNNSYGEKRPSNIQPKRRINNKSLPASRFGMGESQQKAVRTRKKPSIVQIRESEQAHYQQNHHTQGQSNDNQQAESNFNSEIEPTNEVFSDQEKELPSQAENSLGYVDKENDNYDNKYQTGNGKKAVMQRNGGRGNNTKNLNKPLAVISEQIASIYNKSKKQPEKVTVTVAQNTQIQRLKIMNRTSSLDTNVQMDNSSENTSSNADDQPAQQQRVKLKRPTNFARKLLADTAKQMSESAATASPPPLPTSPPPTTGSQRSTLHDESFAPSELIVHDDVEDDRTSSQNFVVPVEFTDQDNNAKNNNNNTDNDNTSRTDTSINDESNGKSSKSKYLETQT